jgi:hypothetical protein
MVLRAIPDRPVEEDHLGAGARELLDQQDLVRIAAGQAIRGLDVDDVDRRESDEIAQTLQGRADQAGAAVAVVNEQQSIRDTVAIPRGPRLQLAELAVDGVPLSLLVG